MKKLYAVTTLLVLSLAVGVTAMAQVEMANKTAKKIGCASCQNSGANPEQVRKFKIDSLDLRQAMMNKLFDLQRENLKDNPDSTRITAIKAEMEAIKTKIDALRAAAKLPQSASCCQDDGSLLDGSCATCQGGKGCGCPDCKTGTSGAKRAKAGRHCKDCNLAADCSCQDCQCKDCKGAGCDKGAKAAGCDKCNKGKP